MLRQPQKYKTCRRYNNPGEAHSLTFTCFHGKPFLSRDRTRSWLIDAIDFARSSLAFDVWAYVIMPEHVHLILWPRERNHSISRILEAIKLPVTRRALAFVKQETPEFLGQMLDRQPNGKSAHRFWQRGGGYDRNLANPGSIWSTINYVHANPVRRGLVDRPVDWKWSSAGFHAGTDDSPLRIDVESLPNPPTL